MKRIAMLLFVSLLISCSDDSERAIDPDLQEYFDLFKEAGDARGFEIDFEAKNITAEIRTIVDNSILGQCFTNSKEIIIDRGYWDGLSEIDREFLIFHELGHCYLDRGHLDTDNPDGTCISMMHSSPQVCDGNYFPETREIYWDELFNP